MFQRLRRLWESDQQEPEISYFVSKKAVIVSVKAPAESWIVRYQGSFWEARSPVVTANFVPGEWVTVIGLQNIILLIQP